MQERVRTAVTTTPAESAKRLDAQLSDVAGALYDVDSGGDVVFVRAQADAGNQTAAALVTSLGLAWERYPLAKDAVDRLDAAVAARDHAGVDALLGPAAVTLADGTTIGIAPLIQDVALRVDHLGQDVGRIAATARQAVARLDTARTVYQVLLVRAGAVGADGDVELTVVRDALDRVTAEVVADPATAGGLADLDRLLDAARDRVAVLERSHRELPGLLRATAAQVDEIDAVVAQAADALARTREKIAAPAGMLGVPDPTAGGDRALRPWLDRIQAQAGTGAEEEAAAGLAGWHKAADAMLAEARAAAAANGAPLARRNELRGLLDAYRAKAAASGGDEDGRLSRLHAGAKDVLYRAPCDLGVAEALVRDYVAAVNAVVKGVR